MDSKGTEVNRLSMASAILNGGLYRQRVMNQIKNRFRARAPEVGLDYEALYAVCKWMEHRERSYRGINLLGAVVIFVSAAFGLAGLGAAVIVGLILYAIQLRKAYQERFTFGQAFKNGQFDLARIRDQYEIDLTDRERRLMPSPNDNVFIYRGFSPFVGAGLPLGAWSMSVNVKRPKQGLGRGMTPEPFTVSEIYREVSRTIANLNIRGLQIRDALFVNGSDLGNDRELLPRRFARPVQQVDARAIEQVMNNPSSQIRHYKWIQIHDWGSEIVMSSFLRCTLQGTNLFIEESSFLLTPLEDVYRGIDKMAVPGWRTKLEWFVTESIASPFKILASVLVLGLKALAGIANIFESEDGRIKREIRMNPRYNYGAESSLRASFSGNSFLHYFQKMDKEFYDKTLQRQTLDAIADFLDERGIDVSEMKDRQATILNSGIIVQGGDVTAQSLAVGSQATASVMNRAKAKVQSAAGVGGRAS